MRGLWIVPMLITMAAFSANGATLETVSCSSTEITLAGYTETSTLDPLDIRELQIYEFDTATGISVASLSHPGSAYADFEVSIARYDALGKDRIYSKFVAEETGVQRNIPQFVTVFGDDVSATTFPYPSATSKKGLCVKMNSRNTDPAVKAEVEAFLLNDATNSLKIKHATVTIWANFLFQDTAAGALETYTLPGEGVFYIANSVTLAEVDRVVEALSESDVIISLVVILGSSHESQLWYPGACHDTTKVSAIAPNTANANVAYWKAAMEFLVGRYTGGAHGKVVNYIVGNEVNVGGIWNNMGTNVPLSDFSEQYARALRVAYTAAKKKCKHARVYMSETYHWGEAYDADDCYKSRDILDWVQTNTATHGDFPWHLAFHPYPSSMASPWPTFAAWEDPYAEDNDLSPVVNFKNLHILTQYLGAAKFQVGGSGRRIILTEQGFSTSAAKSDGMGEGISRVVQAAEYVYAYYKAREMPDIDCFNYYSHVDYDTKHTDWDNGLWTAVDFEVNDPLAKKDIYYVLQSIDTPSGDFVGNFAKTVLGITNWTQLIPGWTADPAATNAVGIPQPSSSVWAVSDYDGDGYSDAVVYQTNTAAGYWFLRRFVGGKECIAWNVSWGYNTTTPMAGNYGDINGEKKADLAVYERPTGNWYIRHVADGLPPIAMMNWGGSNLDPVAGDYDWAADGTNDLAAYDRTTGNWFIRHIAAGAICFGLNWGGPGLVPVAGDYGGPGTAGRYDLAVYETNTGNWYIRALGSGPNILICFGQNWGGAGMKPVPGDYNGDGVYDLSVYQESTGYWFIRSLGPTNNPPIAFAQNWGRAGMMPVSGDFNRDGMADLAVYRNVDNQTNWFIRSLGPYPCVPAFNFSWGDPVMKPVGEQKW